MNVVSLVEAVLRRKHFFGADSSRMGIMEGIITPNIIYASKFFL